jgi:hypothetical protein
MNMHENLATDLSLQEIDLIAGGPLPAVAAFFASPAGAATIAAVGAVATAAIAYVTSVSSDDCTTTKSYDSQGRVVRETHVCN